MKLTIRKIIDILVYRSDVSENDRNELIKIAEGEGLFIDEKTCIDNAERKICNSRYLGIKASTWDNKIFYFYTMERDHVENVMHIMGYDSHGYWLSFFNNPPEPATPANFEFKGGKNDG